MYQLNSRNVIANTSYLCGFFFARERIVRIKHTNSKIRKRGFARSLALCVADFVVACQLNHSFIRHCQLSHPIRSLCLSVLYIVFGGRSVCVCVKWQCCELPCPSYSCIQIVCRFARATHMRDIVHTLFALTRP